MNEDSVLISYAHDKMLKSMEDYVITSTSFLDVRQQALLLSEFSRYNDTKVLLYGGFDTSERAIMVFIPQYLYHDFSVEKGTGAVLLGEVSQCNDDNNDNRFNPPVGRFPKIEEDEEPIYLLCNEYPKAKER